jgi:hypothetical protein
MRTSVRWFLAVGFTAVLSDAHRDQTPAFSKAMRAKLGHRRPFAVVITSGRLLDRESCALAPAVRDPAWAAALAEPDYLPERRLSRALQDPRGIGRRDLEAAGNAQITLTASCVRGHLQMTRRRIAK